LKLAAAGVHLLIEKPLALSHEGIEDLRRTVASENVVAAVAYVHRAHPALAAMRREVIGGRFGAPVEIVATCGQNFPTYRPAYRQTYYAHRATGGGAVQDALTHVIDAGQWLVGPIDKLAADGSHQLLDGVQVEDTVHVIARHGRVMGTYSLNQHQMPNELTISVHCERGTARYEMHESRWRWMTQPASDWHDERHHASERDALFVNQANAFLDAVEGKSAPMCSLEDGIAALNVNLAILSSMTQQSWCAVAH
jgi:predicted dehydrogenase